MKDPADKFTVDITMPPRGRGRPALFGAAMSPADKQRRYRSGKHQRNKAAILDPSQASDASHLDLLRSMMGGPVTAAKRTVILNTLDELRRRYTK